MRSSSLKTASLILLLATAAGAPAHEPSRPAASKVTTEVPLHEDLGHHGYSVRTASPLSQQYFNQGLRLAYAFNHAEALRSFRAAQAHDPACAMCFWGEAFVLGPNINAAMTGDAADPALEAVRQALAVARDPREQALIRALEKRYSSPAAGSEQGVRDRAYAETMGTLVRQYPGDHEIAVLYADALMNTTPWDYWESDGVTPKGPIGEAIRAVEEALRANPNHPMAIHLYIHLTEASRRPERAEPYADKLGALMPGAGHLVHMAFHVYNRVGRHRDAVAVNKAAVVADELALERMEVGPIYRNGYYPHNIHSTIASARMAGDPATALEYARRLEGKIDADAAATIGWVQRILAVPYFTHAQFSSPKTVLALEDPGPRFAYVRAMWHYARGVASARVGDVAAAQREAAAIARINRDGDFAMLHAWGVPARDLLRIARHVVEGRIAQAKRDFERAAAEFLVAIEIQDSLPYVEPHWWYYPVRQTLGATLLMAGHPARAVPVLERSLENYPNNVYALYLLAKACDAAGDQPAAAAAARRLRKAAIDRPPAIALEAL